MSQLKCLPGYLEGKTIKAATHLEQIWKRFESDLEVPNILISGHLDGKMNNGSHRQKSPSFPEFRGKCMFCGHLFPLKLLLF